MESIQIKKIVRLRVLHFLETQLEVERQLEHAKRILISDRDPESFLFARDLGLYSANSINENGHAYFANQDNP